MFFKYIIYLLFSVQCVELTKLGGLHDGLSGRPQYTSNQEVHRMGFLGLLMTTLIWTGKYMIDFMSYSGFSEKNYFFVLFYCIKFVVSKPILDNNLPADSDNNMIYWMTMVVIFLTFVGLAAAVAVRLNKASLIIPNDVGFDALKNGLEFHSADEAEDYLKLWSAENFSHLIIRGSFRGNETTNGMIQFTCPHGIQRKLKYKDKRHHQHHLYYGCCAMVNVMQNRQEKKLSFTKVIKEHTGHMIGRDVYGSYQKVRKMSDNDLQMITELEAVGASRRRVASALIDKAGNKSIRMFHNIYRVLPQLSEILFQFHQTKVIFQNQICYCLHTTYL